MPLVNKRVISTYNMVGNARGLLGFINDINSDDLQTSLVHVMDQEGNHVKQARLEEIVLQNGSKIYNLVLKMDS